MKILSSLLLAAAMLPAAHAQNNSPGTGCVWSDTHGSCMVANNTDRPMKCDIRIQVTTDNSQKTTKLNGIIVEARASYHTKQFRAAWDDKIENAQVAARCK